MSRWYTQNSTPKSKNTTYAQKNDDDSPPHLTLYLLLFLSYKVHVIMIEIDYNSPSATPTLKVMRIQSPQLSKSQTPSLSSPYLSSSLILPDSFGIIHIGETFTAYLGAINVSQSSPVTNLSISSTLQTPTKRWPLPSVLEKKQPLNEDERNSFQPLHIMPLGGVDAIISMPLEEVGQHILRLDVSFGGPDPMLPPNMQSSLSSHRDDGSGDYTNSNSNISSQSIPNQQRRKTLCKFYRFHVSSPLYMKELTLRGGEASCYVSLAVENSAPNNSTTAIADGGLTIAQTEFQPFTGLIAKAISPNNKNEIKKSATQLFDECGRLNPGESKRYLFLVKAATEDAALRGIAKGDELGKAVVTWRKAMGEAGRIASTFVCCPSSDVGNIFLEREKAQRSKVMMGQKGYVATKEEQVQQLDANANSIMDFDDISSQEDRFVVHGSGLSVDVAASAAEHSASSHAPSEISSVPTLDSIFPITVEPIDPPNRMVIGKPVKIQFLIVNHSNKVQNLQLQFRLPLMKGVVVCGQSFQNLGEIQPEGGSDVATVSLVAFAPGLFFVKGCYVSNLDTGMAVKQPPLFSVFVDKDNNHQ